MPSIVEQTFKLVWFMEDYSFYAGHTVNGEQWLTTEIIPVQALGGTEWQFNICPRTVEELFVCGPQRNPYAGEEGEDEEKESVSFLYTVVISGSGGNVMYQNEGEVVDLPPKHQFSMVTIPTSELSREELEKDQLNVTFEFRSSKSSDTPIDISSVKWKDELQVLSDDMRRLFQSGDRSDVRLESNDGDSVPAHLCVVYARWQALRGAFRDAPGVPTSIGCRRMSSRLLRGFVSYLYTGTIPESEVTDEILEFVAKESTLTRDCFHTHPREMSIRSNLRKERLDFTLSMSSGESVDVHRVLPLIGMEDMDVLVDISTVGNGDPNICVCFSLSECPENSWVRVQCSAITVDRVVLSETHYFTDAFVPWFFPHLLTDRLGRVDFELCVSVGPCPVDTESTVTEFNTGSLAVRHVELLAEELGRFFADEEEILDVFDAQLRTQDGVFLSSKSVLSVRSKVFEKVFLPCERDDASVIVPGSDDETLSSILEYLYTGWTKLASMEDALKIESLARGMELHRLVAKCKQYISMFACRMMH